MKDLGVTNKHVVKVTSSTKVIDAFNSMQEAKRRGLSSTRMHRLLTHSHACAGAAVVDEKEEFLFDLSAKDLKVQFHLLSPPDPSSLFLILMCPGFFMF